MGLFGQSGFSALRVRRRVMGFALPLSEWLVIFWSPVISGSDLPGWVFGVAWGASFVAFSAATGSLAELSLRSTAAWQGRRVEDLSPGRGFRGFFGMTAAEPWWVTWSILACWSWLPAWGIVLALAGLAGVETIPLGQSLGVLGAFALAPVVRWVTGEKPEPAPFGGK